MDTGFEKCDNCGKLLLHSSIGSHLGYCLKNIKPCPECKEPVDLKDLNRHIEEIHRCQKCTYCLKPIAKSKCQEHEQRLCVQRPIACSYCENRIPYKQYSVHQESCAARTMVCEHCSSTISVRNKEFHDVVCAGKDDPNVEVFAMLASQDEFDMPTERNQRRKNRINHHSLNEDAQLEEAIRASLRDQARSNN